MVLDLGFVLDYLFWMLLIMIRMMGMLLFNPILGRSNVPVRVTLGLSFFLAIALRGMIPAPALAVDVSLLQMLPYILVELSVGMLAGFIMRLFLTVLVISGDMIDMSIGIAMAKAFDPGSNASVALSTTWLNAMYILMFFLTNNHLTLIHLTVQSFQIVPLGSTSITPQAWYYVPELMTTIFLFAVKLALPIVILEVVMTMGVGIIMRVVPQINVFVVNIQMKLLLGILTLLVLIPTFMGFVENLILLCYERIAEVWFLIPG